MDSNPWFQTGDLIQQRYLLQQRFGQGANGRQTWLALDLASHAFGWLWRSPRLNTLPWFNTLKLLTFQRSPQWVTIKLLAFSPQLQWSEFKLFERESEVLQSLDHPRIPRYHHSFEISEPQGGGITWFALVQEYVPGHSLAELLARSKVFNEAITQKIAQDVLNILIYLHESQPSILHRDIKPSNLILGQSGETYLIDFGTVQAQNTTTDLTLTIVGSSGYAPLEQYWGKAVPASDLYGLGATLIHLLSGFPPREALGAESPPWAESLRLSAAFQRWLERMTHPLPEKRYLSAREALKSLQGLDRAVPERSTLSLNPKSIPLNRIKRYHSEDGLALQVPSGQSRLGFPLHFSGQTKRLFLSRFGLWSLTLWSFLIVPILMVTSFWWNEQQSLLFWEFQLLCSLNILIVLILYLGDWGINIFEKTHLAFGSDQYEITKTILGIKFYQQKGSNQEILGVFPHPNQDTYQVSLNTKDKVYFFGKNLQASQADSLVKEIRTWLQNHPN